MATTAPTRLQPQAYRGPDTYERILGTVALVLLGCVLVALARGQAQWGEIPLGIWAHLATVTSALALTPVILWRRRGDGNHRVLGYVWVSLMAVTAMASFFVSVVRPGHWSVIHLLSVYTLIQLPILVWRARQGNHKAHRGALRGMVTGALLIAGFFTFGFHRLLAQWLFEG
jgi:uncharacterized membrane protein